MLVEAAVAAATEPLQVMPLLQESHIQLPWALVGMEQLLLPGQARGDRRVIVQYLAILQMKFHLLVAAVVVVLLSMAFKMG